MLVLFLGGPWHNQRREVAPVRSAASPFLPTHFTVTPDPDGNPVTAPGSSAAPAGPVGPVTYTRRYARGNGERLPVYVSPDYGGPARA